MGRPPLPAGQRKPRRSGPSGVVVAADDGGAEARRLIRGYLLRLLPTLETDLLAPGLLRELERGEPDAALPEGSLSRAQQSGLSLNVLSRLARGAQRVGEGHRKALGGGNIPVVD